MASFSPSKGVDQLIFNWTDIRRLLHNGASAANHQLKLLACQSSSVHTRGAFDIVFYCST
jgi:hypothetical protein